MSLGVQQIIEQVPSVIIADTKATITENIAIFRPNAYITDKTMCLDDYNFILLSSTPPPAKIGRKLYQFQKQDLIAIGSGVEYLCTANVPTLEYINLTISKRFFEEIWHEATQLPAIKFPEVGYRYSVHLLRNIMCLENEINGMPERCPLMVQSLANQLIIQLLRDTQKIKPLRRKRIHQEDPYIKSALEYLFSYSPINLSLEQICESIDLGPHQLISMFQEATGSTLHEYLQGFLQHKKSTYEKLIKLNCALPKHVRLTMREVEICSYLLERYEYTYISEKLFITQNTLKAHIKHIYEKLEVSKRRELGLRIEQLYNVILQS